MKTNVFLAFFVVLAVVSYASASECRTGDVRNEDCNRCRCLNGVWACTKIGCLTKREIPARFDVASRVKRDAADECVTGESKKLDCNTCYCTNGVWACTLIGCLHGPDHFDSRVKRADHCSTGDVKQIECNNTCHCFDGNWACTEIGCLTMEIPVPVDTKSRVKRENHVAEDLKDTPCAPDDYFRIDCNVCYCNLERTGYLCTQNSCYNNNQESSTVGRSVEKSTSDEMVESTENGNKFSNFSPLEWSQEESRSTVAGQTWSLDTELPSTQFSNGSDVEEDLRD